jgi:putative ABC transport system ATP-binding protein
VFQEYALFPWRTARQNIAFGPLVRRLPQAEQEQVAERYLAMVGLAEHAQKYPRELSGGMKQRVAIARALAGSAPILLADEPTANLDSQVGTQVLEMFRALAKQENRALVIVTHDPKVRTIADRVAKIQDGALV